VWPLAWSWLLAAEEVGGGGGPRCWPGIGGDEHIILSYRRLGADQDSFLHE
jgi:hypothetical protein